MADVQKTWTEFLQLCILQTGYLSDIQQADRQPLFGHANSFWEAKIIIVALKGSPNCIHYNVL